MTGLGFITILLTAGFLLNGMLLGWGVEQTSRALSAPRSHQSVMLGMMTAATVFFLAVMGAMMVWGTWFCRWPINIQAYHGNLESWGFMMMLRFCGHLVFLGIGGYHLLNEIGNGLEALAKRIARFLPSRRTSPQ